LTGNILIIGDTHIPFEHKNYLEFCVETKKKYKCSEIVHIGDLVDFHSISRHEHNPDGFSPYQEREETIKHLQAWYKAFPELALCIGNHDERLEKAAWRFGLSSSFFKSFEQVFELPKKWDYKIEYYLYNIRIFHGMGYSGQGAHSSAVRENQCSVVIGHLHSNAGVWWTANERDRSFGLAVGCGVDRNSYAFNYGRDMRRKPMIGCGVILDEGKIPAFIPMEL